MTLAFSTQLNGKPTYFVEKICKSLREVCVGKFYPTAMASKVINLSYYHKCLPKSHTIRTDAKDRWHKGRLIHFVINNRTKNRFQFAPVIKVVSTQKIEIKHYPAGTAIIIDGIHSLSEFEATRLAISDGFETLNDFLAYFDKDFNGKIIHWTNLKY